MGEEIEKKNLLGINYKFLLYVTRLLQMYWLFASENRDHGSQNH